ncbi:MAG TPA: PKD domain-containing protein [Bacteroides sp.]|nr:PKD domain-containing protein [Bacteroides sp.]
MNSNKNLFPVMLVLWLAVCSGSVLEAQMLADFETPETSPALSAEDSAAVVDNPDKTGINPSQNVGYYRKISGNWHYVSLHFPDTVDIRYNNTLTFKLRASTRGRIFAKFWLDSQVVIENWCPSWNFQPAPGTWVECEMDMTAAMGKRFTRLQLAACVDNNDTADVWFDDVKLSNPASGDGSPVLEFTLSDRNVETGAEIILDASGSFDYDGEIVEYLWDFGDGNSAYGPVVSHTYAADSIFTVHVTITDNEGKTAGDSVTVFVIDPGDALSMPLMTTPVPETHRKIEAIFHSRLPYVNPYDPDEVKVDAVVMYPDGDSALVPCFFHVPARYDQGDWITDPGQQSWMVRFTTEQQGTHGLSLLLEDAGGIWRSEIYSVEVGAGTATGIVREDTANRQYFRHASGEPCYPLGINIGWNNMENYSTIIRNLSDGRANMFRYWHTPFAWQALEWSVDYYYNYGGLGVYNQEAAAMSDSLLDLCDSEDVCMQLVIFQHGMFSENVDAMWETNPYNTANGGYVDRAEEFFYDENCRIQAKKLLRYIVARWAYSRNLFAWEFFNEVQFTGLHNSQSEQWWPAVADWHSEMSRYVESIDPFDHLQTTSAAEEQLAGLDSIAALDNLQYHLYAEADALLERQVQLDRRFRSELEHVSVINGEYGTRDGADTPFDMQRNAVWNGIMTQVPRYMWIWEHYLDPAWAGLFSMPAKYLEGEDFASAGQLNDYTFRVDHPDRTFRRNGLSADTAFYGYLYDPLYTTGLTGATLTLEQLPVANYSVIWYLPVEGTVLTQDSIPLIRGSHVFDLPRFSKSLAFKVKKHSEYLLPIAWTRNDTVVAVGTPATLCGGRSYSPNADSLSYLWILQEKPGSSVSSLDQADSACATLIPDVAGIYRLTLVVSDGQGSSSPDEVVVRGSDPPVAVAGPDTTITILETHLYVDGSASFDPDGDAITFHWSLLSAPAESRWLLGDTASPAAKLIVDAEGAFVLELTVSDGISESAPDTVTVTVTGDPSGTKPGKVTGIPGPVYTVAPNPTTGKVRITSRTGERILRLEVIDPLGRVILQKVPAVTESGECELDLRETLRAGAPLILRITGAAHSELRQLLLMDR